MRRGVLGAALGAVLLAVSIGLALVGRAVLATPATLAPVALDLPGGGSVQPRHAGLADRAAASLLGIDRDRAFPEVVGIYRRAVALLAAAGDPKGPVGISRLIPRLTSPEERSQALTMAATLLAYSAGAGLGVTVPAGVQGATRSALTQAVADYRAAVVADPADEAAKYDLELLLRERAAQRQQQKRQARKQAKERAKYAKRRKGGRTKGRRSRHAGIYATGSGY